MSKKSQAFLQPVITDLKAAFAKANIPTNFPLVAEQRANDDNKYTLCLVVGRDNPLFDEGGAGEEILQEISHKHKEYLGLDFTETIGTAAGIWGSGIDYVSW